MLRLSAGWRVLIGLVWFCLVTISAGAQRTVLPAPNAGAVPTAVVRADPYTPHIPARALEYIHTQRTLGFLALGWSLLGLWLLVRSGLSVWLRDAVYRAVRRPAPEENSPPPLRAILMFYGLYTFLLILWNLPFGLAELATERRYGFSHESVGLYLLDAAKGWGLALTLVLLLRGVYWLVARSPRWWWLWMWGLTLPLLIGIMIVEPDTQRLYNHYTPLGQGPLRTKILELAARAGVPNADVLVEDTSSRTAHVNAYVTGIGPSARIVLNDTALQSLPEDQLLAMIGHEMGHYVEKHVWYGLLSGALGAGAFYYLAFRLWPLLERRTRQSKTGLRGPFDLAVLPLLFFYVHVAILIQDPIANAESRYMEHRADAFGLRLTGLHEATARLMVGFAERDFSDPYPPALLHFWFGTHPTLQERIDFALSGDVKSDVPPSAHP